MTAREKFTELRRVLTPALGASEAEAAARILMEDLAGFDRKKLFADGDRTLLDFIEDKLDAATKRILDGEPVQYAVGSARFCGLDLGVSPAVLIPRPETEGLVDLVTDRLAGRRDLRGLDVCTGSGCIAVALARALPFSEIKACDISDEALALARANGKRLAPGVEFFKADALRLPVQASGSYDFIVSNPPYVLPSEKAGMDARVLDHEPALALFVPEDSPLLFYEAIADYALKALRQGGMLFFEINQAEGGAMRKMLADKGFDRSSIEILKDFTGRDRYAIARR
ncbi:MAG: peptide chain release factor N(5)-glutamine methyltransferase [Muribaculaceae bacterium]|nr:peptide chain release factor N(5)-glutamine methyltransferase [Muribaculaceae bacterium]